MKQQEYIIAKADGATTDCEEERADCAGQLYEVKYSDNDEEHDTHYFFTCKVHLESWLKTVDRAALMTYI